MITDDLAEPFLDNYSMLCILLFIGTQILFSCQQGTLNFHSNFPKRFVRILMCRKLKYCFIRLYFDNLLVLLNAF